ncbi:ZP domain-containing protein-like [Dendropsophus ebraccatus]|uniref:ZP domain-containing protein-like n=1 Tax=Dendropsophus ebraccatus TaxID=150705 RepID=UPI0038314526
MFAVRVDKCIATPSNNINDPTYVTFVSGGCAVSADIPSVVIENGNSTEARFQISAFMFQGFSDMYIFCDVILCNKTKGCAGCNTGRSSTTGSAQLGIQLNLQPMNFFSSSGHFTDASRTVLAVSLLGLLSLNLF